MNKTIATLLSAVSILSLTACEEACTMEARLSARVHISDADGEPMEGQVQFDAGDGLVDCYQIGSIIGDYSCAYEIGGDLDILVSAEGYQNHIETVTIDSDVCHVITQELDIELVPEVQE
ncbi:MAG: hypothetical protein ACI9VR_005313 [Cognaticolwellia sp.]|jgi:hypothetical protein